jgi:hypothetical protein
MRPRVIRHLVKLAVLVLLGLGGAAACTPAEEEHATGADTQPSRSEPAVRAPSEPRSDPLSEAEQRAARAINAVLSGVDAERRIIDLTEIVSGGVGADDGIPAIHDPRFVTQVEAADWLSDREPVITLEVDGEAKIYPIQILIWHEIVNDELAGRPVVVTFCPLCNTALSFDRRVAGEVRRFGVSGYLRESDLVMFDYETHTLWQQITAEGIVGADAGVRLRFLPSHIVSFADARATYPEAPVLSRETGHARRYGENPYSGYDRIDSPVIFAASTEDDRLPPKARVLTVDLGGEAAAFPFDTLAERRVVHAEVGGQRIVAFWQPGTATAIDAPQIAEARSVGAATAFIPYLDGRFVEFEARDGRIYDVATGSRWNVLGLAVEGPLEGKRLESVVSGNHLWFSWAVFKPDTRIIR